MTDQGSYWSHKDIRRVQKNPFADTCATYLRGSEELLDLGCGRGEDAIYFAQLGCIVTALDISEVNVEHLKHAARDKNHAINVIQSDISHPLPFEDRTFSAVYACLSLHYFDDKTTKAIFREIERVLKLDGLLFVKCESVDDLLYGKGEFIAQDIYKNEHVRHFFSEQYMRECLMLFEVISIKKTSGVYADYRSEFIEAVARLNVPALNAS